MNVIYIYNKTIFSMGKLKNVVVNLIFYFFFVILCLILLNLYFSLFGLRNFRNIYLSGNNYNLRYMLKPKSVTIVEGVVYKINSFGFRDKELNSDYVKDRKYRILCVGDSITFGEGVSTNKTYPKLLEKELRSKFSKNIEVLNAGVPGYNTYDELLYIKNYLIKLSPDMIILGFFMGNDSEDPSLEFNNKMSSNKDELVDLFYYLKEAERKKKLHNTGFWQKYRDSIWDPDSDQWKRCVDSLISINSLQKNIILNC